MNSRITNVLSSIGFIALLGTLIGISIYSVKNGGFRQNIPGSVQTQTQAEAQTVPSEIPKKVETVLFYSGGTFIRGWTNVSDVFLPSSGTIYFYDSEKKYIRARGDVIVMSQ